MLNSFCGLSSYLTGNTLSKYFMLYVQLLLSQGVNHRKPGYESSHSQGYFVNVYVLNMALGLAQPPPKKKKPVPGMFLGGKGGRCVGLTTLPPSCADCLEIWETQTFWNPQGLSRLVMGLLYLISVHCISNKPCTMLQKHLRGFV